VTEGHVLVQGLQERENWPGSEGERVFITEGRGRGECARGSRLNEVGSQTRRRERGEA